MKYPKLTLLFASFLVAYALHEMGFFEGVESLFNGYGYVSMFFAGALFGFGFTAPFGIALMVDVSGSVHPLLASIVGAVGTLCTDLLIFSTIRFTVFHEEIYSLRETRLIRKLHAIVHHKSISERLRTWILWSVAGLVIASPLPDEFGVTLVSSASDIKPRQFAVLSFAFNMLGILVILTGADLLARIF